MIIIERPRQSGKTTMLLHYMVFNPLSIYVARTEDYAKHTYELSQNLKLDISKGRFKSMVDVAHYNVPLLIDDMDFILKRHPSIGFELFARAAVITITKGPA